MKRFGCWRDLMLLPGRSAHWGPPRHEEICSIRHRSRLRSRDARWCITSAELSSFVHAIPGHMFDVNVGGTRNIIEACRRAGVVRLVHTSSTVTLGERPGNIGSESTSHRGSFLTQYEESKCEAETLAIEASTAGDLEVVVVNPSSVQGPGRSTGTGKLLLDAVNGKLPLMFDVPFSIVDVDDCARGHALAAARGMTGERYVLSGFTVTAREALDMLSDLTGRRSSVRVLPTWLLRPLGPVADVVGRFVDSVPVCSESVRQMRAGAQYDGSRATRELGLTYRSPRETFTRVLEWFRAEGLTDR